MTQEGQEGVVDESIVHDHAYQSVPSKTEDSIPLNRVGTTAHTIAVLPPNEMSGEGHFVIDTCLSTDWYGAVTGDGEKIKMLCQVDAGTQKGDDVMTTGNIRCDNRDDNEVATVAPSIGGDHKKQTGKDKIFQIIDTSCLGDTVLELS